ncbi:MAG: X2-like carbohydrate binding domain-containing protein [Lawsonibacter sp.]|nr:X2-like carbohydrate binding domain-containing protein [Lawsonibacter sp.]
MINNKTLFPYHAPVRVTQYAHSINTFNAPATISITTQPITYAAQVTPDGKDFQTEILGYSTVPDETFTINSTGSGILSNLTVTIDGKDKDSFTLDTESTATSLDKKASATTSTSFSVRPNDGLPVGDYTATLRIKANEIEEITKTIHFTVIPVRTYIIEPSPKNIEFPDKVAGYTSAPAAQTVCLSNVGNQSVLATLPSRPNYEIIGVGDDYSDGSILIAPNDTAYLTIQPVTGLPAGNYDETITFICNDNATFTMDLKFEVSPPELIKYDITKGAKNIWKKGSGKTCEFVVNAPLSKFDGSVTVDDNTVDIDGYTISEGSTTVTLKASYLQTLSVGKHTLRINFTDGYAQTTFTVIASASDNPPTGDSSMPWLWIGILALSGAGIAGSVILFRRKQYGSNK